MIHDRFNTYLEDVKASFGALLPEGHTKIVGLNDISKALTDIVLDFAESAKQSEKAVVWGAETDESAQAEPAYISW